MTENSLNSTDPLHNYNCDGCNCKDPLGKVRIVRIDDSSNAHLCIDCYKHEVIEGGLIALPFSLLPMYFPPEETEVQGYEDSEQWMQAYSSRSSGFSYDLYNESNNQAKAEELAVLWDYDDIDNVLSDSDLMMDSVSPGICMNPCCDYTTEVEPDCSTGYCEVCETQSVASIHILLGII